MGDGFKLSKSCPAGHPQSIRLIENVGDPTLLLERWKQKFDPRNDRLRDFFEGNSVTESL